MGLPWQEVPLQDRVSLNVDPRVVKRGFLRLENLYFNQEGGLSRFPGLEPFADVGGGRVYLDEFRGDLVAVTDRGRVFRIDAKGVSTEVTGVHVSGGKRPTFAATQDELIIAAGGPIIRLSGNTTEILSEQAPETTHVGFLDGYVLAIEPFSQRFFYSDPENPRIWNPIDFLTAESQPDFNNSLIVTPFRELLVGGIDSLEQFESTASGTQPFFRRFAAGEGVFAPYTLTFADRSAYALNRDREFVRVSGQLSTPEDRDISFKLEQAVDVSEAWAKEILISGQRFILLQLPNAINEYDSLGITFLFDFEKRRWTELFGFNAATGLPIKWPGVSYKEISTLGRRFVGGENGVIYELKSDIYTSAGQKTRAFFSTHHISANGQVAISDIKLTLKRGVGSYTEDPHIAMRVSRDQRPYTRWVERSLGKSGDNFPAIRFGGVGTGETFSFEFRCADNVDIDIRKMEIRVRSAN